MLAGGRVLLFQMNLPSFILFVTAGVVAITAGLTWQRRSARGGNNLFRLTVSLFIWSFCAGMEAFFPDVPDKLVWAKFEYLGAATAAPFFLIFTLVFTHRARVFNTPRLIAFWTIPAATIFLVFTNDLYHLVWKYFITNPDINSHAIIYVPEPEYWVNLSFAYLCLIVSTVLFVMELKRAQGTRRKQIAAILIGLSFPWLFSVIDNFAPQPIYPGLDLTPIGFAFAGIALTWAFTSTGLLSLVSIAHKTLIEQLQDGVIVIDTNNRVIEVNSAAAHLLNRTSLPLGEDVFITFKPWSILASALVQKNSQTTEVLLPGSPARYLDVRVAQVLNSRKGILGYLAILHETTDRKRAELALQQKSLELEQRSITDDLTGLFNRRNLDKFVEQECRRAERYHIPVAFALFDVDDYKKINDTYGHLCGDVVLRFVAASLKHEVRTTDITARIGGDEFFVIFPHTNQKQAWLVMDRLRRRLGETEQQCGDFTVSISAGVTAWIPGDVPEEIVRRVDGLLYQAKEQGKNRVIHDE